MSQPLSFNQVILKLHEFWAQQGCAIWEPYNVQVGAGTGNPATLLRVLGPEPWRVAYVEPSVRPDDGRYGDNPNRMQKYYQYQVILKPDPGNPQELYLQSLEALGINPRQHDIRFVEDNWESPALGAWGLGWEVWLDGQEITQFTYFQQAGGLELNPVSVEITYGVERIVLALQGKNSAWEIDWLPGLSYADMIFNEEVEHCRYYFDIADVDGLKQVYDTYEHEVGRALEGDALISGYDYVLKCSHLFNVLDTRGAIGVTERATYFRRMRDMTRMVAKAYAAKREQLGHPLLKMMDKWGVTLPTFTPPASYPAPTQAADFLLELGVEELPAQDVDSALEQLRQAVPALLQELRLAYTSIATYATPRRLVALVKDLAPRQRDEEYIAKGPPAERAFDAAGKPTKAAEGFAKGKGVDVSALKIEEMDGGQYVTALVKEIGQATPQVLAAALPKLISGLKFPKTMRWNATDIAFSRPLRWLVALYGDVVVPFEYAGSISGSSTRGLRPYGSPELAVASAAAYAGVMAGQGIVLDREARRASIRQQVAALAAEVGGTVPADEGLLDEVVNLVEAPIAVRGSFEAKYLELPRDVLITVMRDKQRYFAVEGADGALLPYFITIRNGDREHTDMVAHGNEHVLRARFSDASYFFNQDLKKPLLQHLQRLTTLTFQEKLGSMYDKNQRVVGLLPALAALFGLEAGLTTAQSAAAILKADLGAQMVVEMTSLQGTMGREYALREGQPAEVAQAIFEHWLPRGAGDRLPASPAGTLVALADKLDSLAGLFAAGLAPKATSDPYGLRRAALGVVQIAIHNQMDIDLRRALDVAAAAQPVAISDDLRGQLAEFVRGRLEAYLADLGEFPRDVLNAVLAEQGHNPYRALMGARELLAWTQRPDWFSVLDNFARCVRITRSVSNAYAVEPSLFQSDEERALFAAYEAARATLPLEGNVGAFLTAFAPMVAAIQGFFDHVMVNVEDAALRGNRLGLLQAISALAVGRADLSLLTGF